MMTTNSAVTGPTACVMFLVQQTLSQNTMSFSLRQLTTPGIKGYGFIQLIMVNVATKLEDNYLQEQHSNEEDAQLMLTNPRDAFRG